MSSPVLVAAMGTALAAVALTGCSGDGAVATGGPPTAARPSGPGGSAVVRAAEALTRAGSARVRTAMEMASGGTRVTIEGSGLFDLSRATGRLRVTLPPGADGARPGERRPVTELITPDALYMKNRAGVPADKWVRVATAGLPDGNLVTGGATDPITAAQLLRGARRIASEGATELDGERVWHYSGLVDIERAADAAPPRARHRLRAAEKGFSGRTVPFDAYLDAQGRLRKVQHRFSFTTDAAGKDPVGAEPTGSAEPSVAPAMDLTVSSTTRLGDFGVEARIAMPEAGDIWAGKIAAG
ncbi:hypothetical protein DQ392_16060 [Streptomyces reniochalinae]|uniref:LppX_LprAFG lipoprotein n=2 Tax=Streptomyces reniochalinae TaxID=2250578 RepID=A0A367EKC3_9ACTN|nr:hypothetical protein [Streptomyces reniochalinae]RCG18162.1 hypothetical protein DQ392_16060 [Streptomyces reniochalinae]